MQRQPRILQLVLFDELVIGISDRNEIADNESTTAARLVQNARELLELLSTVRERVARLEVYVYDAKEGVWCVRGKEVHLSPSLSVALGSCSRKTGPKMNFPSTSRPSIFSFESRLYAKRFLDSRVMVVNCLSSSFGSTSVVRKAWRILGLPKSGMNFGPDLLQAEDVGNSTLEDVVDENKAAS